MCYVFLALCSCSKLRNKHNQWESQLSISRLTLPCRDQNTVTSSKCSSFSCYWTWDGVQQRSPITLFSVPTAVRMNFITSSLLLSLHKVLADKTILLQHCDDTWSADHLPFTTNPQHIHLTDIYRCVRCVALRLLNETRLASTGPFNIQIYFMGPTETRILSIISVFLSDLQQSWLGHPLWHLVSFHSHCLPAACNKTDIYLT